MATMRAQSCDGRTLKSVHRMWNLRSFYDTSKGELNTHTRMQIHTPKHSGVARRRT